MRKGLLKNILVFVCGVVSAAGFAIGATYAAADTATERLETVLPSVSVEETYKQGSVITLPKVSLNVGGEDRETVVLVVLPNGQVKKVNKLLLEMLGNYELRYKAMVDGKEYYESVYFSVVGDLAAEMDEIAPTITLDYAPFTEATLPEEVPVDCNYPIYKATAKDAVTGSCNVSVRAFYDYFNYDSRYELDVYNGYFTPDKTGVYTLVYTAQDGYGNTETKLLSVNVTNRQYPLSLSVEEGDTEILCGNEMTLGTCSYSGGIGELTLQCDVVDAFGNATECSAGGSFRPMNFGMYEVRFTLTDSVGQKSVKSYFVNAAMNVQPVFFEDPVLPRYFIEGTSYVLSAYTAYDMSAGAEIETSISMKDGNGENAYTGSYIPVANTDGVAEITYTAQGATDSFSKTYTIPVVKAIDNYKFDMAKYFQGQNISTAAGESSVTVSANAQAESAYFEFIRDIYVDNMSVILGIDSAANNFSKITFIMSDYEDASKTVNFGFVKGNASDSISYLYMNGEKTTMATATTFFSGADYQFSYDVSKGLLTEAGGIGNAYLVEYANGEPFEGFPSGRIYFRVELDGIEGESKIEVKSINLQNFTSSTRDAVKPTIIFNEEYPANLKAGDTMKIPESFVIDVLDPSVVSSMSFQYRAGSDSSWTTLTAKDGTVLENCAILPYEVFIAGSGDYRITYTFEDTSNRAESMYYNFTVYDLSGPVISIDTEWEQTVTLGSTVSLPNVTLTDNQAGECKYDMLLLDPTGYLTIVKNDFTATIAGEYELRIIAFDANDNMSMSRVYITAVAEEVTEDNAKKWADEKDYLVKDGESDYKILYSTSITDNEYQAITELVDLFYSATGIYLEAVSDEDIFVFLSNYHYISIGDTKLAELARVDYDRATYGDQGYRIETVANSIFIRSGGHYGLIYGVYQFLTEQFGYDYYAEGIWSFDLPTDNCRLVDVAINDAPAIPWMASSYQEANVGDEVARRLRIYKTSEAIMSAPSISPWHNTLNYVEQILAGTHSNWFATMGGQLCYSRDVEGLSNYILAKMTKLLDENPTINILTLTQMDNANWCDCGTCTAIIKNFGGYIQSTQILFINVLAKKVQAWVDVNYPGREVVIGIFAYWHTTDAPVKEINGEYKPYAPEMVLEDNVAVFYAPFQQTNWLEPFDQPINEYTQKQLEKWSVLTKNWFLWGYGAHFGNYMTFYNWWNMVQSFYRVAEGVNTQYMFYQIQMESARGVDWARLKMYIQGKLAWDPDIDMNYYIDKWFDNYFGAAAKPMKELFDQQRTLAQKIHEESGRAYNAEYLNANTVSVNTVKCWLELIDEAYEAIEYLKDIDPEKYQEMKDNICAESLVVRSLYYRVFGNTMTISEKAAFRQEFLDDCNRLGCTRYSEGASVNNAY